MSVGITDEFMRQVALGPNYQEYWKCTWDGRPMLPRRVVRDARFGFASATTVTMNAYQIFSEIVESAWKTGEPGVVFLDTVNKTNPLPGLGRLEACNPCGGRCGFRFVHSND